MESDIFRIRGFHAVSRAFPDASAKYRFSHQLHGSSPCGPATPLKGFRLLRVRSPLLAQSLLISLPALLRWFTSRSIAPPQYLLPARGVCLATYGLPHSAICGSLDVCSSPQLFAAYRGLLRRTAPRHPPQTYTCLTIFSFPRSKLPTAHALKPSSLPYYFQRACVPCRYALYSVLFLNLGQNRVELLTPALSERCSNQLSYCPVFDNSRTARGHRERKKADAV